MEFLLHAKLLVVEPYPALLRGIFKSESSVARWLWFRVCLKVTVNDCVGLLSSLSLPGDVQVGSISKPSPFFIGKLQFFVGC